MPYGGTKNLRCGVIDSIAKSVSNTVKDANKVKCEGCDDYEAATMHCVDCGQNFGPQCLSTHRKMKVSTSHQLLPLHDVLKGKVEVTRVPRCQKHPMFELNTFCNACSVVACPQCAVSDHLGHTFRPLGMVSGDLRDRIIDMAFTISQREEMARKAISALDDAIFSADDSRPAAEKEIQSFSALLHSALDARIAELVSDVHEKGDQLRKSKVKDKEDTQSAAAELRGFTTFVEGLVAQGSPLEIAGSFQEVIKGSLFLFSFFSFYFFLLFVIFLIF